MARPLIAVPSYPRLAHGRVDGWDSEAFAVPSRYVDMRMMAPEEIDKRAGKASLPPLIKGYLRLGGFVGEAEAVVDGPGHPDLGAVAREWKAPLPPGGCPRRRAVVCLMWSPRGGLMG